MIRRAAIIPVVLVVASLLCGGCGLISGEAVPAPVMQPSILPVMPEPCGLLKVTSSGTMPGQYLTFQGCSELPEGTVLESRFYVDKKPAEWWPEDAVTEVNGKGYWRLDVSLEGLSEEETGVYMGNPASLKLEVWVQDNPDISAGWSYDLLGPPAN